MLRQLVLLSLIALTVGSPAWPAIWPEEFFGYKRVSVAPASPGEAPIWEEYGFDEGETARYELDGKQFSGTAFRFRDATSAMAVFQWQQPAGAEPAELTALSVQWDSGVYFAHGNYVFRFEGFKPSTEQVVGQLLIVPMLEQSPLPTWVEFIPVDGRLPGSQKFVIGPEGLEQFESRIPPSVAGFHYGPEIQISEFGSPAGPLKMAVLNYPTPHIARERLAEFRMLDGALVKRTGSMLAVVFDPVDPEAAQKLLSLVDYRPNITWDQYSFRSEPTLVEIVLTAFLFLGLLFSLSIIFGALFGGLKFLGWGKRGREEEAMVALHLSDK
jgi:hypothetical protein